MAFLNRIFDLLLTVLALNHIWAIRAQLFSGTSVILGKKHYYIETTTTGNFFEAAHYCAQYDMALATIENKNEHLSLLSFLQKTENLDKQYWISGTSYGGATPYSFKWLGNGKSVSYMPNSAPLTAGQHECLSTAVDTFQYANTVNCITASLNFICEKPVEPNCGKLGQCRYTYSSSSN